MSVVALATWVALALPAGTFAADEMDWGFRSAFRSYVYAGTGAPPLRANAGATCSPNPDTQRGGCDPKIATADGVFGWTATSSSDVLPSGAGTIDLQGTVTFSRPDHFFLLSLIDPTVTIEGDGDALLNARVVLTIIPPFAGENVDERLDLGEYTLTSPVQVSPTTAPGGTSVVKVATVKRDKSLKVAARATIVTLDEASQGALEIVLTIGADRYCAACSAPRKDAAGLFAAKGCPAPAGCS